MPEFKKYRRTFKPCREIRNGGTCSWEASCGYCHTTDGSPDPRHTDYQKWFEETYGTPNDAPSMEDITHGLFSAPSSKKVLDAATTAEEPSAAQQKTLMQKYIHT